MFYNTPIVVKDREKVQIYDNSREIIIFKENLNSKILNYERFYPLVSDEFVTKSEE